MAFSAFCCCFASSSNERNHYQLSQLNFLLNPFFPFFLLKTAVCSAISLHLIFIGIQSTDQHFLPILFPSLFLLDLHSGAFAQSNSSRKWKSVSNRMKFLFSKMSSRKTVQWMDGSNYFNRLKCLFISTALVQMLVHLCVSWKAIWQIKCSTNLPNVLGIKWSFDDNERVVGRWEERNISQSKDMLIRLIQAFNLYSDRDHLSIASKNRNFV